MSNEKPVLYSYWRSSCSWRVRIALNLKNIDYEYRTVNLLSQEAVHSDDFVAANPVRKVPALVINGQSLGESMAIMEYLEETFPEGTSILPKDPIKRAKARAVAMQIAAGIQPIQNVRLIKYLNAKEAGSGVKWAAYWMADGLRDLEAMLARESGKYCVGDEITIADLCLPSILYNAKRFKVDLAEFPIASRINESLSQIEAFKQAEPDRQPDANLNA